MVRIYCSKCQRSINFNPPGSKTHSYTNDPYYNRIDVSGVADHKTTTNYIFEGKCPYCGTMIYKRSASYKGD
jgi:hypothetical protein